MNGKFAALQRTKGIGVTSPQLAVASLILLMPPLAEAQSADADQSNQSTNQPAGWKSDKSLQLSWGAFDFHPHLREAVVYDDNILFAAKNQQQAVINQLTPGLLIAGGDRTSLRSCVASSEMFDLTGLNPSWLVIQSSELWPDKFVLLDYSPRWQKFTQHSANDSLDQFLTFNAVWPMAKLAIGVRQDYRDETTVLIEALRRSEVEQIHTEVDAGYRLNDKFSVDTAFERQDVAYPGSTNLTGYVEWKGTLSVNRQIFDLFNVSLFTADGIDQVGSGLDQSFERLGVRVRYELTRMFIVDGSVGVEDRQFDSGRSDEVSPFFNVGATYQPWERAYFRLNITRQQSASLNNGYSYVSSGGNLTLHKDFTDRFSVQTELGYYQTDSNPIRNVANNSKPSDYYSLQLKGKVKLLKYLDAEAFYLFRGAGISQNDNVVQGNQCGLQVSYHY
jgi:hypothetical protein